MNSNNSFLLSRLSITGKVDISTPLVVLLEIIDAHLIDVDSIESTQDLDKLIEIINNEKVESVGKTFTVNDYSKISVFVNSNVEWTVGELHSAFLYLKNFRDIEEFKNIKPDFEVGSQTPENIHSLNLCVIYAACKYYGITLNFNTSAEEMVVLLREYLSNPKTVINSIVTILQNLEIDKLIDIRGLINNYINPKNKKKKKPVAEVNLPKEKNVETPIDKDKEIERNIPKTEVPKKEEGVLKHEELVSIANELTTFYPSQDAIKSKEIKNSREAVVIAYMYYDVDISSVDNPLEIIKYLKNPDSIKTEVPLEIENLTDDFNAEFPIEMYSQNRLNELLVREGYSIDEVSPIESVEKYELLQTIKFTNTFYYGVRKAVNVKTLEEFIDIDQLKSYEAISYGSGELYHVFTYKELYNLININKNLMNPYTKEQFSSLGLKKLIYLSSVGKYRDEPMSEYLIRTKLKDLIIQVQQLTNDHFIINIRNKISSDNTDTTKEIISRFMELLIQLTMNMRGWSGNNAPKGYPIEDAYNPDEDATEIRVSDSIKEIALYIDNFPDICTDILDLPLVKYQNGRYINSTPDNGLTIKNKLEIVKDKTKINACIRMSSNWLGCSLYKYCKLLDIDPGYSLEKWRFIA